ncbi:SRPBCC family protein [Actinokineospora pegani]|uniref:SRPBCC family protein n=1 Tax=Actinokineospora pegani TaxID=2654637 RepID=UPI0012EADEE2|nr:SRPBCC family protein [Actinokineospora pegani]
MNPTGKILRTPAGLDLELVRSYRAPIDDVWASVTEPERTARWFGPWEGEAAPGAVIKVQMAFEDDTPWGEMTVVACEPPRRLAVSMVDEHGSWHLELLLSERAGTTELRFVHHLEDEKNVPGTGAGWEYYLDRLTAAREGTPMPDFADYYPAMRPYFEDQLRG